jgi:hypothetical protein
MLIHIAAPVRPDTLVVTRCTHCTTSILNMSTQHWCGQVILLVFNGLVGVNIDRGTRAESRAS